MKFDTLSIYRRGKRIAHAARFLVLVGSIAFATPTIFAQSLILTSTDDLRSLDIGNTFSIDVAVSGLRAQQTLDYLAARIEYDATHIATTSLSPGSGLPNALALTLMETPGTVETIYDTLFVPGANITADVTVATLNFSVLTSDNSAIAFSFLDALGHEHGTAFTELTPGELLEVTAPAPTHVYLRSSSWSDSFRAEIDHLELGHPTIDGIGIDVTSEFAMGTIPWSDLDIITMSLPNPISDDELTLLGSSDGPNVPVIASSEMLDDHTIQWKLESPLERNRYLLQHAESDSDIRFDILPGDTNRSGGVSVNDVAPLRTPLGRTIGDSEYSILGDLNGSGTVAINDLGAIRINLGRVLPTDVPTSAIVNVVPEPSDFRLLLAIIAFYAEGRMRGDRLRSGKCRAPMQVR